jgi:hypothetical protein
MSRYAVAIAIGDWANREKPAIRAFPDQVCHIDRGLASCGIA